MDDITSTIATILNFVSPRSAWGAVFALIGLGLQLWIRGEWPTGRTNDGAPQTLDPKALATAAVASVLLGVVAANYFNLDVTKSGVREELAFATISAQADADKGAANTSAEEANEVQSKLEEPAKNDRNYNSLVGQIRDVKQWSEQKQGASRSMMAVAKSASDVATAAAQKAYFISKARSDAESAKMDADGLKNEAGEFRKLADAAKSDPKQEEGAKQEAEHAAADADLRASIAADDAANRAAMARTLEAADVGASSSRVLAALTLIAFGYVAADARPFAKKIADLLKKMVAALVPKSGGAQPTPPPPQQVAGGTR